MNEVILPNGWAMATLGDVADEAVGRSGPVSSEFIYVDISSIDREQKCISDAKVLETTAAPSRAKQVLQSGDVLISMTRPNLNAIAMATPEFHGAIGSTGFHVLRSKWVEPKFLFYLVHTREFIEKMCLCVQGALYPAVRPIDITSFSFSLPSRPEQHRIVAKIEELFSELDKGIENLKTARAQLKVYRQALLKHAFEGKLTAQWRKENQDKLETAAALLKRIQQERTQRYQQQLADWQANGGSKPKAPKPLPPLTAEELAELPELPDGWGWVRLDEISENITDGDHQAPPQSKEGVPFITISDIKNQRIDFSDTRYVSQTYFDGLSEMRKPVKDDILYTVTGSFGIPCLIDFDRDFCFQRHIGLIRSCEKISKKFLFYSLSSRHVYGQAASVATGTAQKTVPLGGLRLFKIPLMSYEEQQQIANEIEARLSEVDQLEQTIATSLQQAEALRQSILKKAFSGQLVPQDPHDEPASELLARIQSEREQSTKLKRGGVSS